MRNSGTQANEIDDLINGDFSHFMNPIPDQISIGQKSKESIFVQRSFGGGVEVLPPDDWNDDYPNPEPNNWIFTILILISSFLILSWLSVHWKIIERLNNNQRPIQTKKETDLYFSQSQFTATDRLDLENIIWLVSKRSQKCFGMVITYLPDISRNFLSI